MIPVDVRQGIAFVVIPGDTLGTWEARTTDAPICTALGTNPYDAEGNLFLLLSRTGRLAYDPWEIPTYAPHRSAESPQRRAE